MCTVHRDRMSISVHLPNWPEWPRGHVLVISSLEPNSHLKPGFQRVMPIGEKHDQEKRKELKANPWYCSDANAAWSNDLTLLKGWSKTCHCLEGLLWLFHIWADKRFLCSPLSAISHFTFKWKLLNRQMVLWLGALNFENSPEMGFCWKWTVPCTWVWTANLQSSPLLPETVQEQLWDENKAALKRPWLCWTALAQAGSLLFCCPLPPSLSHPQNEQQEPALQYLLVGALTSPKKPLCAAKPELDNSTWLQGALRAAGSWEGRIIQVLLCDTGAAVAFSLFLSPQNSLFFFPTNSLQ